MFWSIKKLIEFRKKSIYIPKYIKIFDDQRFVPVYAVTHAYTAFPLEPLT